MLHINYQLTFEWMIAIVVQSRGEQEWWVEMRRSEQEAWEHLWSVMLVNRGSKNKRKSVKQTGDESSCVVLHTDRGASWVTGGRSAAEHGLNGLNGFHSLNVEGFFWSDDHWVYIIGSFFQLIPIEIVSIINNDLLISSKEPHINFPPVGPEHWNFSLHVGWFAVQWWSTTLDPQVSRSYCAVVAMIQSFIALFTCIIHYIKKLHPLQQHKASQSRDGEESSVKAGNPSVSL